MELIEIYKGVKIFKSSRTGFYKIGSVLGADVSDLTMVKKLIDIKTKKQLL